MRRRSAARGTASKEVSCCSMPPAKRSSSEAGRPAMSSGGTKAALATGAEGAVAGKRRKPPRAPARESSAIDPRHGRQTRQARRRRPVQHRRDQRHDRGEIDLAAEKAQRGRGRPLAAAIHRTAEAEALAILLAQPGGATARLAAQTAPNGARHHIVAAARRPGGGRKIAVEDEELLMELGVGQHSLVQGVRPLN